MTFSLHKTVDIMTRMPPFQFLHGHMEHLFASVYKERRMCYDSKIRISKNDMRIFVLNLLTIYAFCDIIFCVVERWPRG